MPMSTEIGELDNSLFRRLFLKQEQMETFFQLSFFLVGFDFVVVVDLLEKET
jgi:hypothetical protein